MKKIIIILIMSIAASTITYGQTSKKPKVTLDFDIDWGRKKFDCKRGFGICDVDVSVGLTWERVGNNTFAIATRAEDQEGFSIEIPLDKLGKDLQEMYFSGDVLLIEDDYTLSEKTASALGLAAGYTIKAGKYSITKTKTSYLVSF